MPFSLRENNQLVTKFVADQGIKTILDIGPGFGAYARILRDDPAVRKNLERIEAVEIYQPYINQFHLARHYDAIYVADVRDVAAADDSLQGGYDLIIFGDVLEHMTRAEALAVWQWASRYATYGMISVPTVHWPQEGLENPHETHVQDDLTAEEIIADYGPFHTWRQYQQTATFFKEF
jgi:predicted TPR repeat methyltransferase